MVVDTVFLGFTNMPAGTVVDLFSAQDFSAPIGQAAASHSYRRAPARNAYAVFAAPVALRYLRLRVAAFAAPLIAGVVAAGLAIRPTGGTDLDWGRPINDPTTVTRLPSGGFGLDAAVATSGFQWTMPALTDDERDRLFALQLDLGIGETLLVLEDPAVVTARNEAAHWSKLTKLEPFARQAPGETKWAMQVWDWA